MKSENMKIVYKALDELQAYENNPRHNDKAVGAVAASIDRFGWKQPLVIDKDGVIVAGHTRAKAAEMLGLRVVPCVVADDLTEDEIRAYRLADNKVAELADWDFDKLEEEMAELADVDFDMTAFGFDEIEEEDEEEDNPRELKEDEPPEMDEDEEPRSKLGDIWQLGRHRLMCGDSTDKGNVLRLLDGAKADMVFTDPPYGVNVKGGKGKGNLIMGDLTQTAIPFSFEIAVEVATKEKAHFYFCGGESNLQLYQKLFDRYLHMLPKHLIWVKNGFVMKMNGYHNQFEIIFHGYKQGSGALWFSGRTENEASDVWHVKRDAVQNYLHPTQKPLELPARAIRNSSAVGAIVFEPFGGSGSTLIACEQLERTCYAMELDPRFCDVIIKRWEQLTGETAELVSE